MADFSKLLRPAGRVVTVPSLEPDLWLEADYGVGICGARDFDGIGEYFEIDGYTPVGTNDLTLCGWFYSTNNSTHIVFYGGLTNGISIYYLGGSDLRVYYPDGEGSYSTITSGAVNVLPNVWNFFVATVDRDGQLNLYVNDMETPTATDEDISASDGEDWTRSNNAQIGGSGLQYFFEGRICRVGWAVGHVLSQTEREELYNNGNGKTYQELSESLRDKFSHYWNGNEASGDMVDQAGGVTAVASGGELVTNWSFDGDIDGWTNQATRPWDTAEYADGDAHLVCNGDRDPSYCVFSQDPIPIVVGREYVMTYKATKNSGNNIRMRIEDGLLSNTNVSAEDTNIESGVEQTITFTALASNEQLDIFASNSAAADWDINYFSIKSTGPRAGAGPRQATAADIAGGHHGTLTGFANTVSCWSSDVPDGSYTATFQDSTGGHDGTMQGFDDLDAARVDPPSGPNTAIWQDAAGSYPGVLKGFDDLFAARCSPPSGVPYLVGARAIQFDGSDDYVDCGDDDAFSFGDGSTDSPFSVAAWIKPADATNFYVIHKFDGTPGKLEWILRLGSEDKLEGICYDMSELSYIGRKDATVRTSQENSWFHVAMTYDGSGDSSGIKLYVDGVQDDDANLSGGTGEYAAMENTEQPMMLGARVNTGVYSTGSIADARIYNAALTPAQVASLAGGEDVTDNLVANWQDAQLNIPHLDGCKALEFDGDDDEVQTAAGDHPYETSLSDHTWSAWVYWTGSTSNSIAGIFSLAGWPKALGVVTGNKRIRAFVNVDGGTDAASTSSTNSFLANRWNHVACRFSTTGDQKIDVFINGVEDNGEEHTARSGGDAYDASSHTVWIGDTMSGGSNFDGVIADPRMYTKALTDAQIRALANGENVTDGLAAAYAGDDDTLSVPATAGGRSLVFPGDQEYVDIGTGEDIFGGLSATTIAFWMKAQFDANRKFLFDDSWTDGTTRFQIECETDEDIEVRVRDTSGATRQDTYVDTPISDGQWHHVACVIDLANDSIDIYVDGTSQTTGGSSTFTGSTFAAAASSKTKIGTNYSATANNGYHGLLTDMRIYGAALSAADVALLYGGTDASVDPIAHWPMTDGPQQGAPSDGDPIAQLMSREGRRILASQPTYAYRPTFVYQASEFHARPALDFDGTQFLSFTDTFLSEDIGRLMLVILPDDVENNYVWFAQSIDGEANNHCYVATLAGKLALVCDVDGSTVTLTGDQTLSTTKCSLVEVASDGDTVRAWVNGVEQNLTGTNGGEFFGDPTGVGDTATLGCVEKDTDADAAAGRWAAALGWNSEPTDDRVSRARKYLCNKYDITLTTRASSSSSSS